MELNHHTFSLFLFHSYFTSPLHWRKIYNAIPWELLFYTPGGLHLLSERTTHKKIDGKPHLVYKGFSQSRKRNAALIERVRPSEADYVVEFWSYPPILPVASVAPRPPASSEGFDLGEHGYGLLLRERNGECGGDGLIHVVVLVAAEATADDEFWSV